MTAYFNGQYLPKSAITISADDRGFLFADGLYEVVRSYDGRLFKTDEHISRLNRGARYLRFPEHNFFYLKEVADKLLRKNELFADATIYFQITRGAAPRSHSFPDSATPLTVFAEAKAFDPEKGRKDRETGISVITVPDLRWARCDLKTVGLTANVLANQQAMENGAKEALFVRDGVVLEGSHSNFMAVRNNCLFTAPASNTILHGITRQVILEIACDCGVPVCQEPIFSQEIGDISEAFICGTTTEITPVTSMDGRPVGSGTSGPVTRRLQTAFKALTRHV